jgi:hypothetical protein
MTNDDNKRLLKRKADAAWPRNSSTSMSLRETRLRPTGSLSATA